MKLKVAHYKILISFHSVLQLCEFFHSTKLKSSISKTTKIKPSLGTTFLQKVKECFGGKMEFAQHVDKYVL